MLRKPTIRMGDLKGFKCKALLVDHSVIDFKSVFKAEKQIAKASNGGRGGERI